MMARVIRFLTENWALKLAALGLAILLWLAVTADDPQRAAFPRTPVEVDLRDPGWRLQRLDPATVTVHVLGPRGELVELGSDPPRIVLPVEGVSDSIEIQVVPLHWVQLPAGVTDSRVLALRPDTIRLYYQRMASRTLPVRVRIQNDLPEGLALALPFNTNPSTVQVRGPVNVLSRLDSVPLLPLDVSGIRSTTNVPVGVDSTELQQLSFDPGEVNVVIRVVPVDSQADLQPDSVRERPPF